MTNTIAIKLVQAIFKLKESEALRLAYEMSLLDTNEL